MHRQARMNQTGVDDLDVAARILLDRGVGAVAVTVGEQGALLLRPDVEPVSVPALPTTVVDTTGCGDSFQRGHDRRTPVRMHPEDAALIGSACGALVASGLGSDAGIVDLAGVLARIVDFNPEAGRRIDGLVSARTIVAPDA